MSFRLVPKSVTLNNLERRSGPYFALLHRIWKTCVPTLNRFIDHWIYWSEVGFYNTLTGEVSVRKLLHAFAGGVNLGVTYI